MWRACWEPFPLRNIREEDRQDIATDRDGKVTFNRLQQRLSDTTAKPATPVEQAGTTDIWGITD